MMITKSGKLIQHWPYLADKHDPQTCVDGIVGTDKTEEDLWSELARQTLRAEGGVLVVGLYSNDKRHYVIREQLSRVGDVDFSRVVHPHLEPITRKITVRAREAYEIEFEKANGEWSDDTPPIWIAGEITYHHVPARSAGVEKKTFHKRFHLGSSRNLQILITAVNERATVKSIIKSYSADDERGGCPISAVLIMEPNLDEGDLTYLEDFRKACPGVDVYIFHRWDDTKYGIEITGDVDNWENEFPALADVEKETQEVIVDNMMIKGNVHVVSGPPEAFKTMGLIELSSAILDERPVFDLLKVNRRYPILFLCADMSKEQLDEWAAPFNLRKHGPDFRVLKGNSGIPNITDPVLQEAVRGRILILDTMLDFAKIQKAFESGEWNTFMQQLRELITVHSCVAVVMTAHATRAEVKNDSDNISAAQYFKDSVTFHGKVDIGFGCKVLKDTSQVKWERIKGRGFKYNKFSFTVAVYDEQGNSNLDRGRFPMCTPPEGMKQLTEERKAQNGRKPNSDKQLKIEYAKSVNGSWQEKADAVNAKFGSDHDRSTIGKWLKEFDEDEL